MTIYLVHLQLFVLLYTLNVLIKLPNLLSNTICTWRRINYSYSVQNRVYWRHRLIRAYPSHLYPISCLLRWRSAPFCNHKPFPIHWQRSLVECVPRASIKKLWFQRTSYVRATLHAQRRAESALMHFYKVIVVFNAKDWTVVVAVIVDSDARQTGLSFVSWLPVWRMHLTNTSTLNVYSSFSWLAAGLRRVCVHALSWDIPFVPTPMNIF